MIKEMKVLNKASCCPSRTPTQKQSPFAPRPFAPQVEEHEAPAAGPGIDFSFSDISILPQETVQPKLVLGPVGDRYEQEADRVARQVVDTISSSDRESVQREEAEEEEEDLIQGKFASGLTGTLGTREEATPNRTGLPDHLKSGLESLSGMDLSDVRVHYNSPKPAQLNALAYAQGREIHVGPGQERHLPHEGWHAVQQMWGQVRPTMQYMGVSINDDVALEREAHVMGAKALRMRRSDQVEIGSTSLMSTSELQTRADCAVHEVQLKTLEQTGWVSGLKEDESKRAIVGGVGEGSAYYDTKSLDATDRTNAFQVLATRNGQIGKTVDDRARSEWGKGKNDKWTANRAMYGTTSTNTLDPFFYEGIANWTNPDKYGTGEPGKEYLGFMYQHAKSFTGYVEAILDTSNNYAQGVPSMYKDDQDLIAAKSDTRRNPKFTNIHDTLDTSNILDMTTSGDKEKNLDAYTKIAGEGARWQCVREHARYLKNDSWFYTAKGSPKRDEVWAVDFMTLWKSWDSVFGKAYDITKDEVSTKLADSRVKWGIARPPKGPTKSRKGVKRISLSEKDKNLDA